jgi:hypothetical protein
VALTASTEFVAPCGETEIHAHGECSVLGVLTPFFFFFWFFSEPAPSPPPTRDAHTEIPMRRQDGVGQPHLDHTVASRVTCTDVWSRQCSLVLRQQLPQHRCSFIRWQPRILASPLEHRVRHQRDGHTARRRRLINTRDRLHDPGTTLSVGCMRVVDNTVDRTDRWPTQSADTTRANVATNALARQSGTTAPSPRGMH